MPGSKSFLNSCSFNTSGLSNTPSEKKRVRKALSLKKSPIATLSRTPSAIPCFVTDRGPLLSKDSKIGLTPKKLCRYLRNQHLMYAIYPGGLSPLQAGAENSDRRQRIIAVRSSFLWLSASERIGYGPALFEAN